VVVSELQPGDLPAEFLRRLAEIVPRDRQERVLAAFGVVRRPAFRVNSLCAADEQVLSELAACGVEARPVSGLAHVYQVEPEQRSALVRSAAAASGRLYVQNLSSLLAAPALGVEPGMTVLDLAAAPGGKTLHLACLMNNTGTLSAVESNRSRLYRLRYNLRRHGVTCCRTYLRDGRAVGRWCPGRFDRVLLDAPCSGEARLRTTAGGRRPNWSETKIRQCAGKQRRLLASAIQACRPGGTVLYCTCSMAPEENEAVVADVLEHFAEHVEVESVPLPAEAQKAAVPGLVHWRGRGFPAQLDRSVRILPDDDFDAFYMCRLKLRC